MNSTELRELSFRVRAAPFPLRTLNPNSIEKRFLEIVARVAPAQRELAAQTLARVPATRWQIEWYLPWWLGETFGLDETCAQEFVVSNVLGLVALRLQDDAADGELNVATRARAMKLATTMQHAALEMYHPHFPRTASFWRYANWQMEKWRAATRRVNDLRVKDLNVLRDMQHPTTRCLAGLGAPLKISARAISELTAREQFSTCAALLDHLLLAAVLHDHAVDARADLDAGRGNLFVAAVSPLRQTHANQNQLRACVADAWFSGTIPRVYFQLIRHHCRHARMLNHQLGVPGIAHYLADFSRTIKESRKKMSAQYRIAITHAGETMFGTLFARGKNLKCVHSPTLQ